MIKTGSICFIFILCIGFSFGQERILCKHQLGESIVPKYPKRVVVMDDGALDQLDKLGVGGIVAVPTRAPGHLKKYESDQYTKIGDPWAPDLEAVRQAEPDFIIYGARDPEVYAKLNQIAPTISYEENYTNYMETYVPYLKSLGQIFGKESMVEKYLVDTYTKIHAIRQLSAQDSNKGLILLYTQGRYHAFGPGSRFGFIHDELDVKPVVDTLSTNIRGTVIDAAFLEASDPDYLFIINRDAVRGGESVGNNVIVNAAIQNTKAYQSDKIIWLTSHQWYLSRHGMNILDTKINDIINGLYPQLN